MDIFGRLDDHYAGKPPLVLHVPGFKTGIAWCRLTGVPRDTYISAWPILRSQ